MTDFWFRILGPSGETRFAAVPEPIRDLFSKRSGEARNSAQELARGKGLEWDSLTGEQQIGLLKAGAGQTRNKKVAESQSDFKGWTSKRLTVDTSISLSSNQVRSSRSAGQKWPTKCRCR
jgi:hypothetical protein